MKEDKGKIWLFLLLVALAVLIASIAIGLASYTPPIEETRCYRVTCPDIDGTFLVFNDEEIGKKQCSTGLSISLPGKCVWEEVSCSECECAK